MRVHPEHRQQVGDMAMVESPTAQDGWGSPRKLKNARAPVRGVDTLWIYLKLRQLKPSETNEFCGFVLPIGVCGW